MISSSITHALMFTKQAQRKNKLNLIILLLEEKGFQELYPNLNPLSEPCRFKLLLNHHKYQEDSHPHIRSVLARYVTVRLHLWWFWATAHMICAKSCLEREIQFDASAVWTFNRNEWVMDETQASGERVKGWKGEWLPLICVGWCGENVLVLPHGGRHGRWKTRLLQSGVET